MTQTGSQASKKRTYHLSFFKFASGVDPAKILTFYRILTHAVDMKGLYYVPSENEGPSIKALHTDENPAYCKECGGVRKEFESREIRLIFQIAKQLGISSRMNCPQEGRCTRGLAQKHRVVGD